MTEEREKERQRRERKKGEGFREKVCVCEKEREGGREINPSFPVSAVLLISAMKVTISGLNIFEILAGKSGSCLQLDFSSLTIFFSSRLFLNAFHFTHVPLFLSNSLIN